MNWRATVFGLGALLALTDVMVASVEKPELSALVEKAVEQTCAEFSVQGLKPAQIAVTLLDERVAGVTQRGSFRGERRIYPASVIKLFFLAYAHQRMEEGQLADTPELRRGLRDMIVDSYNEATSYVVDAVTGTTSGPELPAAELTAWHDKRGAVTRYFETRGYKNVAALRKPWGEGPYGREKQDAATNALARNFLSTDDTARLLDEIANGRSVSPARSAQMMELMARKPFEKTITAAGEEDRQATDYMGAALSSEMKLWSKAGWTSQVRHDAAIIEFPGGGKIILVIFTDSREHAGNRAIIPALAKRILAGLNR
ncbi:serine hydrolase [Oleiharenicola lentus]|uniref:serine hydrolase n=1 Tax=Oleiharenicola lentus TaxID=2508720 RepID=UPI003F678497